MSLQVEFPKRKLAQAALNSVERALGYPVTRRASRASRKGRGKWESLETGYALLCVSPDGSRFGFVMLEADHGALAGVLGLPALTERTELWEGVDR